MQRIHELHELRRRTLLAAGTALAASLAGCGGGGSTERPFETLDSATVYIDDDMSLSVPDEVTTESSPGEAGLLVLPGDTDISPTRSAEWLNNDCSIALLGDDARSTWSGWVMSSPFTTRFDVMNAERGEPNADLLVATALGVNLVTYSRTWDEEPSDREILRELGKIVADIERRTGGN